MSLVYNNGKMIGKCKSYLIEKVQGTSNFVMLENFISREVELNENQQIVLDLLKIWKEKWPSWSVSTVIEYLLEQQNEYHQMLSNQEEAQVLQAFSQWALEQEG